MTPLLALLGWLAGTCGPRQESPRLESSATDVRDFDAAGFDVSVQVVDGRGLPVAGMPVALGRGPDDGNAGSVVGTTAADGSITLTPRLAMRDYGHGLRVWLAFPHADAIHAKVPIAWWTESDAAAAVTPATPFRPRPLHEPLRLVMPETVALEVTFVDAHGDPVHGHGEALAATGSDDLSVTPDSPSFRERRGTTAPGSYIAIRDGRGYLPMVGASSRLALLPSNGYIGGRRLPPTDLGRLAERPRELVAGQPTIRVRVPLGPAGAIVVGRLLRPDGSPAAATRLRVHSRRISAHGEAFASWGFRDHVPSWCGDVTTDGDARFEFEAPEPPSRDLPSRDEDGGCGGEPPDLLLFLSLFDGADRPIQSAPLRLEAGAFPSGVHHVGTQRLIEATRVASGRLIDDRGEPWRHATIALRNVLGTPAGDRPRSEPDARGLLPPAAYLTIFDSMDSANGQGLPPDATDDNGRFSIRRFFFGDESAIELRLPGRSPTVLNGTAGAVDGEFRLERFGTLTTQLIAPEAAMEMRSRGFDPDTLAIAPAGRPEARYCSGLEARSPRYSGPLRRFLLPRGTWQVTIETPPGIAGPPQLVLSEPFTIECGVEAGEPGLERLDLRDRVVLREFLVHDDGSPLPRGRALVHWRPREEGSADSQRRPARVAEFPISAGRCQLALVRGCEAECSIELQSSGWTPLGLALTELPAPPDAVEFAQVEVSFSVRSANPFAPLATRGPLFLAFEREAESTNAVAPPAAARRIKVALPADGAIDVRLPCAGRWRYDVTWLDPAEREQHLPPPTDGSSFGELLLQPGVRRTVWRLVLSSDQIAAIDRSRLERRTE